MARDHFDAFGRDGNGDGASVMDWPRTLDGEAGDDCSELMAAWLAERGRSVEAELLLARAGQLIGRLLGSPEPTAALRREARRLIDEIDDQLR